MSEHFGGTEGPQRPLPPRPPAPPSGGASATGAAAPDAGVQPAENAAVGGAHAASEQRGYGAAPPEGTPYGTAYSGTAYNDAGYNDAGYNGTGYNGAGYNGAGSPNPGGAGDGAAPYGGFGQAPGSAPAAAGRRRHGTGTLVSAMLIAGLLGGAVAVGADAVLDNGDVTAGTTGQERSVIVNNEDSVNAVTAAAVKASPSVVTLDVSAGGSSGTGSGIILDTDGHILTNTHVVTLGGTAADPSVSVQLNDGRVFQAAVVGTDPLSDLAVVKIDADGLTAAELGSSDDLNVGDRVIAIGSPLGLAGTVTDGIVSTLDRTISVQSSAAPEDGSDTSEQAPDDENWFRFAPPDGSSQNQSTASSSIFLNVIQTDAAINHGNSGGALVNTSGQIIGVNVAIASASSTSASEEGGNIGVGFSIPISYAQRVAEEIIDTGSASHGFLGVTVQPATASDTSSFTVGAEVAETVPDSPGARAGLRPGDVVTAVDGIPVTDAQALTAAVRMQPAGAKVSIDYTRDGQPQTAEVTLGDSADQ